MSATAAAPVWEPSPDRVQRATITRYMRWLRARSGQEFPTYAALHEWSIADLEGFWATIWDFFELDGSYDRVLGSRAMPGAEWFPGATLNYAEHLFRRKTGDRPAIQHASELRPLSTWTWDDLRRETARVRSGLQALGVQPGDRVAAYMPNIPEAVAAFLASASLGAIWCSTPPELGAAAVIDRVAQIAPKVLLAVDGYRYGGKDFDRTADAEAIAGAIGARLVRHAHLSGSGWPAGFATASELAFERVPFDYPLWMLFSSGTTGLPKPLVHGHGGVLLEQLKTMHLHVDAQGSDRVFWFTTTGWMMWNFLVGILLTPASIVLYDGSPAGEALWDLAADAGVTVFGTSPAYIRGCLKNGVQPTRGRDLSRLHAVGSTGSPLAPEGYRWVYEQLGDDVWLFSTSGGTDVCSSFVGGVPTLPVYPGELQAPALGCDVQAFNEHGEPVVGQVGELVIAQPMPSMPLRLWGDEDGSRFRDSYFAEYPGVWRHGDWIEITERGTAIVRGRSDATINRGGVRMGTSEIYRAVLALPEVVDALVVDVDGWMPLFVVLRDGAKLDEQLAGAIKRRVRDACSPRHVPDEVRAVPAVPRTLSGKLLEVPVKRILSGEPADRVASRDSLAEPAALEPFRRLAGPDRRPRSTSRNEGIRMTEISTDDQRRGAARALHERSLQLLLAKDMRGWVELWTDDCVFEFPFAPPGYPQRLEGREAVWDYIKDYPTKIDLKAFHDVRYVHAADPDVMVVEMRSEGRAVETGKPYNMQYISIITVRDGKIAHYRDYWNPLAVANALGGVEAFMQAFDTQLAAGRAPDA